MQTKKMSLANIKGALSRAEMKKIMAGSGAGCGDDQDYCGTSGGVAYKCCSTFKCKSDNRCGR